jgi:hypothetical protein
MVSTAQRHTLLRLAAAVYGLAWAIALLPRLTLPAPATQLPGAATAAGFDARASFWFVACVIVLPIVSALLLAYPIRRLADPAARAWAFWTAVAALVASVWIALIEQNLFWTSIPPLLVGRGGREPASRLVQPA